MGGSSRPYGVDVVEVGPINKTIHQVNERVLVADLERLERIYFRIAELLLVEVGKLGSGTVSGTDSV